LLKFHKSQKAGSILTYSIQTAVIALLVGFIVYYAVSKILIYNVEESLVLFAEQGAKNIDIFLDGRLSELKSISSNSIIKNTQLPMERRMSEVKKQLELDSYKRLSIVDMLGNSETTEGGKLNVSDRDYFKKAIKGISNISDPIVSRVDGTVVIIFAVPIVENGKISGALYATYNADVLSQMTDKIKLNSKGSTFILDSEGNTIAHEDRSRIYNNENDFKKVLANHKLDKLVALEKKMIAGQKGSGDYEYNGINKYMGFCPIGQTGWSIAVTSPKSDILGLLNIVFLILILSVLCVTFIMAMLYSRSRILKIDLSRQQVNSTRVADVTNLIVLTIDLDGTIITKNKYAERFFDYFNRIGNDNIQNIFELLTLNESEKLRDLMVSAHLQNSSASFELTLKRAGCEAFHLYCSMMRDKESGNAFNTLEIMGVDITDRVESQNRLQDSFDELTAVYDELAEKEEGLRNNYDELTSVQDKLKMSENRYHLVIEGSNDAIWDWDSVNDEMFFSEKFFEMTGYNLFEIGSGWEGFKNLIHSEDIGLVEKETQSYITGVKPTMRFEVRLKHKNGDYRWLLVKGKAVLNNAGKVVRAAGSFTDINERRKHEQRIRQLAYTDSLTGLPNRVAFYNEIGKAFLEIGDHNKCALIYMDLDNFKYVNDSFSHYMGDLLLVEIGKRLTETMTDNEFIARLEGDEFVVFIRQFGTSVELNEKIRSAMSSFDAPYNVSGNSFNITVSCGISTFPEHSSNISDLIKNSDMAMYQAKKEGKNKHILFEKSMNDEFLQRISMENGLRTAIQNDEFILHYQPQYDLNTGRITGFEALIRWMSPQHGMIAPLKFISVAEETGLIVPIGRWVMLTACSFIQKLNETVQNKLGIAVNVSITQLLQADFVQMVREVLSETGLEPSLLELELTESRLMEAVELNLQKLTELKESGIRISIDDFGRGFSSLSYLKQLPINSLKIDKSFVDDIQNEDNNMIETIIHIGHQRGLTVIAEGVERKEQMEFLTSCNCDKVQGFYYSMPVPENDVGRLLK